ncbi:MAG: endonuclease I family protein [Elusimicrobiales bacterium]
MKRISSFLAVALSAAGFWSSAVSAQNLPTLEHFLTALPSQAVPAPLPPYRVQPQYLAQAAALSGEKLFQYLHTATEYPPAGTGTDYLKAKKYMFSVADNTGCDGRPGVVAFYSQVCVPGSGEHGSSYEEPDDANGDGFYDSDGMNAEHTWPQGYFDKAAPMKSDLHHLFPTFIMVNGKRGNEPFGEVSDPGYATLSGSMLGAEGFEPCDEVKGNVARALLYFFTRYHDRKIRDGMDYKDFWTSRVDLFLEWNRQDPPDAAERRRNDLIEDFQGNRNPFVDEPRLADKIGARVFQSH